MRTFLLAFCLFFGLSGLHAQSEDSLLQFSGLILTSDSLKAIPNTNIYVPNTRRGTVSNAQGFFSLVVRPGDTVIFSNLGFKRVKYGVPMDIENERYSVVQLMTRDTVYLDPTVVYPWPSPEQFREAFLSLNVPDDKLERARKNLEREKLKELGEAMGQDPNESLDQYARNEAYKNYYYGQAPPIQLLNPFAWAQFFKAWKDGLFKKDN